jgi:hypothetical protein
MELVIQKSRREDIALATSEKENGCLREQEKAGG